MRIAIYPGSFDPITKGHIDIIDRAAKMFDKIVIGIFDNNQKNPLFSMQQRINMIKNIFKDNTHVEVICFKGLLADFTRDNNISVVIRGLRAVSDFEYEFQMALTNKKLNANLETVFIPAREYYTYLSSSMVKTLARYGGDVSPFVTDEVATALYVAYGSKRC